MHSDTTHWFCSEDGLALTIVTAEILHYSTSPLWNLHQPLCCLGISKLPVCYYQLFRRELNFCVCGLESFVAFSIMIFLSKIAGRCNEIILNTAVLYLSTLIVPATSAGSWSVLSVWMAAAVCLRAVTRFHLRFLRVGNHKQMEIHGVSGTALCRTCQTSPSCLQMCGVPSIVSLQSMYSQRKRNFEKHFRPTLKVLCEQLQTVLKKLVTSPSRCLW